jgi:hypothetical protein
VSFITLLGLDDPSVNPLVGLPAFTEFQANLEQWMAEPPTAEQLSVVGSHALF